MRSACPSKRTTSLQQSWCWGLLMLLALLPAPALACCVRVDPAEFYYQCTGGVCQLRASLSSHGATGCRRWLDLDRPPAPEIEALLRAQVTHRAEGLFRMHLDKRYLRIWAKRHAAGTDDAFQASDLIRVEKLTLEATTLESLVAERVAQSKRDYGLALLPDLVFFLPLLLWLGWLSLRIHWRMLRGQRHARLMLQQLLVAPATIALLMLTLVDSLCGSSVFAAALLSLMAALLLLCLEGLMSLACWCFRRLRIVES